MTREERDALQRFIDDYVDMKNQAKEEPTLSKVDPDPAPKSGDPIQDSLAKFNAHEYRGPAVSRWKRRRGAGPRVVRLADDFDAPLPDFDDY